MGALLVYDVTKRTTFTDIQRWLTELKQFAEPDCIVMLVGNKYDLIERNNKKRDVSYEEAKAFADENKLLFFETSAISNHKVNECFEDLLQEIYNERRRVSYSSNTYKNIIRLAAKNKKVTNSGQCCQI